MTNQQRAIHHAVCKIALVIAAVVGFSMAGAYAAPTPPVGFITSARHLAVDLNWAASPGAIIYNVYRGTNSGGEIVIKSGVTDTTFTDTALTDGTKYFYQVTSHDGSGVESSRSNELWVMPHTGPAVAPTGLVAIAGDTQTFLTWNPSANGARYYRVFRGTSAGQVVNWIATVGGTSYTDLFQTNGTPYFYKVRAADGNGDGYLSIVASATPMASTPVAPATVAAVNGNGVVTLTWTAPPGATSFNVYRGATPAGESTTPYASGLTGPWWNDTGVTNGATYYYTITAVSAAESAKSSEVSATPSAGAASAPFVVAKYQFDAIWQRNPVVWVPANTVLQVLPGDVIIAVTGAFGGGNVPTDNNGTFIQIINNTYQSQTAEISYEAIITAGTHVISPPLWGSSNQDGSFYLIQVRGLDTSNLVTATGSNKASDATIKAVNYYAEPDHHGLPGISVNLSANAKPGDFVVAVSSHDNVMIYGMSTYTDPPAGWTSIGIQNDSSSYADSEASYRIAATAGNPVSWVWSDNSVNIAAAAVVSFKAKNVNLNTATFIKTDTTTKGNWSGVYGADGYYVAPDANTKVPSYAQVNVGGKYNYTWTSSTSNVRALQKPENLSDRIAGCWFSWQSFTIDINLIDGNTHQVALYALDWDSVTRAETITATDAVTGVVLDTETLPAGSFHGGEYRVWNVKGHVKFTITHVGGNNVTISGLFFS